jgi:hypothetical protein
MKYIFIVIIIKCVDLINGEWIEVFSEDFNDNLDKNDWGTTRNGEIWKRKNKEYI